MVIPVTKVLVAALGGDAQRFKFSDLRQHRLRTPKAFKNELKERSRLWNDHMMSSQCNLLKRHPKICVSSAKFLCVSTVRVHAHTVL
jgi:hypothetical protein